MCDTQRKRVFDLLRGTVATIEAGLCSGGNPRDVLLAAVDRHDLVVPVLLRSLPISQPERISGLRVTRDVVFGTGTQLPAPLPTQSARLVSYGVKPACVIHGSEAALARVCTEAYRLGLVGLLSPVERVLARDSRKNGFANLAGEVRAARPGSGGRRTLILARDASHAVLAWLALTYGWDSLLGFILGYPRCCVGRFVATWERICREYDGDPAESLLENRPARPPDWRINVLGRYLGFKLIDHFPCHWTCEASRQLAERHLQALAQHEAHTVAPLAAALNCPYVWTREWGIVAFPAAVVQPTPCGWGIGYDPLKVLCTCPGNHLLDAVRRADRLFASETSVRILDTSFPARLAVFSEEGI